MSIGWPNSMSIGMSIGWPNSGLLGIGGLLGKRGPLEKRKCGD